MIFHITDVNRQDICFQFKQVNVPLIYTTDCWLITITSSFDRRFPNLNVITNTTQGPLLNTSENRTKEEVSVVLL